MDQKQMENSGLEEKRKRAFAFFCIGFGGLVLFIFTLVDIMEGHMLEAAVNFGMGFAFSFAYIALKKLGRDRLVYKIVLGSLGFFFFFNIHIGSGEGTALMWLYCFPPVFMFFLGKRDGTAAMTVYFCMLCLLLLNPFGIDTYAYTMAVTTRFLPSFLVVSLIAYGLEASREKYQQAVLREKQQLEAALKEIKTLSGLIPICANCKKIRDDKGFWQQVETYIEEHTQVGFSHSICPDCFKIFHPGHDYPDGEKKR